MRIIEFVVPPELPAVRRVRLVDPFMLAFLLLAKPGMLCGAPSACAKATHYGISATGTHGFVSKINEAELTLAAPHLESRRRLVMLGSGL
jgi:hypothetical protein